MTWWLFFYSKRLRKIQEKKKNKHKAVNRMLSLPDLSLKPKENMTILFLLSLQYYNCSLWETSNFLWRAHIPNPFSASGIRLNINLKYICAYSVLQVLLTNSSKRHSAPHGDIHYTVLKQITDLHDLSTVFYPIFYSGPFIKSGMLNFKTQGALPFSFFLNQVPWVLLPWD